MADQLVAPVDAPTDAIRETAARSRLHPRIDADTACHLLRTELGQAAEAYALALLCAAVAATGAPTRFHRPGVTALTFDEAWLARLVGALRQSDLDRACLCIASRLPSHRRPAVRLLAGGLAERLDDLVLEPAEQARGQASSKQPITRGWKTGMQNVATELEEGALAAIIDGLAQAVAVTLVLKMMAQNHHQTVTGMACGPLHELFQKICEDHFEAQDDLAERIKAFDGHAD